MEFEKKEFDTLTESLKFLEDYFRLNPPNVFDTEARFYFERFKYIVVLNKLDWYEND